MAIVIANCWYNLPTIPGKKPAGTNTAAKTRAIATTGPEISAIALKLASLGGRWCSSIYRGTASPLLSHRQPQYQLQAQNPKELAC